MVVRIHRGQLEFAAAKPQDAVRADVMMVEGGLVPTVESKGAVGEPAHGGVFYLITDQ